MILRFSFFKFLLIFILFIFVTKPWASEITSIDNFHPPFHGYDESKRGIEVRGNWRDVIDSSITPIDKIEKLDAMAPKQSSVSTIPWSGDYWPYFRGSLAYRYNQQAMRDVLGNWQDFYDIFKADPPANYLSQSLIKELSPAEKYDLLVGDKKFSLTQYAWNLGRKYFERDYYVPPWLGLCDGQAAASIYYPEPKKYVDVPTPDQSKKIRFYPDDIKALAALLWTQGKYKIGYAGTKCTLANWELSEMSSNDKCFDLNPGSWHLILLNQVGIGKKNLIVDTDAALEVWNFPVLGYKFSYFNILNQNLSDDLNAVKVLYKDAIEHSDQKKIKRHPNTQIIVGVEMEVTYRDLIEAFNYSTFSFFSYDQALQDFYDKVRDARTTKKYRYDLEIDSHGRIIGGHWYQKDHPDFAWIYKEPARSIHADNLPLWNGVFPLPTAFTRYAVGFSSRGGQLFPGASKQGQPLAPIVHALFKLAQ